MANEVEQPSFKANMADEADVISSPSFEEAEDELLALRDDKPNLHLQDKHSPQEGDTAVPGSSQSPMEAMITIAKKWSHKFTDSPVFAPTTLIQPIASIL